MMKTFPSPQKLWKLRYPLSSRHCSGDQTGVSLGRSLERLFFPHPFTPHPSHDCYLSFSPSLEMKFLSGFFVGGILWNMYIITRHYCFFSQCFWFLCFLLRLQSDFALSHILLCFLSNSLPPTTRPDHGLKGFSQKAMGFCLIGCCCFVCFERELGITFPFLDWPLPLPLSLCLAITSSDQMRSISSLTSTKRVTAFNINHQSVSSLRWSRWEKSSHAEICGEVVFGEHQLGNSKVRKREG